MEVEPDDPIPIAQKPMLDMGFVDLDRGLQLLNNAVTRGLTVETIRNANKDEIERAVRIWKRQMLMLLFGD